MLNMSGGHGYLAKNDFAQGSSYDGQLSFDDDSV